jgi:uncharacterized protein YbjT (DUF2867 family)
MRKKKPLIVVTGATGRTGGEVLAGLTGRDDVEVRAAVHSPAKLKSAPSYVEVVALDYADRDSIAQALAGATKVYWVTPGGVEQIDYTRTMVEAAKAAGVAHIVKVGSLDPDIEPITGTDRQCGESERLIAASGIPYTFLRCSFYDQMFVAGVDGLRHGPTFIAISKGRTGWIDCRDIGAVAVEALVGDGHTNKVYNLTGPEVLSFDDIQRIMTGVAGRPVPFVEVPEQALRQMFAHETAECVEARLGCLRKLRGDYIAYVTDDVERLVGRPPISFAQFCRDYAASLFDVSLRSPPPEAHLSPPQPRL